MHLKILSAKCRPFCRGLNVLMYKLQIDFCTTSCCLETSISGETCHKLKCAVAKPGFLNTNTICMLLRSTDLTRRLTALSQLVFSKLQKLSHMMVDTFSIRREACVLSAKIIYLIKRHFI